LFLVIFYVLVIYTRFPIPKKRENTQMYKFMGIGGGLSFLIIPVLWEAIIAFVPIFKGMNIYMKSVIILLSVIVIAIIVSIAIWLFKMYKDKLKIYRMMVLTKEEITCQEEQGSDHQRFCLFDKSFPPKQS